jgi:heme-degrading monooxygenase HmoA
MIAVIFEVYPKEENKQDYLDIASELKPMLKDIDGFISIERFASLQDPNKVLSLSFWENEKAIEEWRNKEKHRKGQGAGLDHIFSNYRIRVGEIMRDYGIKERDEAPGNSNQYHKTNHEK